MCYIRIRNPSDAIIFSQREKKRLEEKSPRKKSKISREGTDVAALRKSLLKKTTLWKRSERFRVKFASHLKKKRTKMKKMSRDARLPPQNKTRELFCCFPYSFEPSSSFDAKRRERTRRDDTMAR
jgi:hypothetical protein